MKLKKGNFARTSCYTFYVTLQWFRSCFPALWLGHMFLSRVLHWFRVCFRTLHLSRVFPAFSTGFTFFPRSGFVFFPRFTLVSWFSHTLHWFHVFLALYAGFVIFPALYSGFMFFPRFTLVSCFSHAFRGCIFHAILKWFPVFYSGFKLYALDTRGNGISDLIWCHWQTHEILAPWVYD